MADLSTVFDVAGHLLGQADKIRATYPEVAAALEADSQRLLEHVPSLSVAQVAELLGQSRPTIYEWIKAGYVLAEEAAGRGTRISPETLLVIIPILQEWQEQGRAGRPGRLLHEWLQGAIERGERRRAFAEQRRTGVANIRRPRRSAEHLVASR